MKQKLTFILLLVVLQNLGAQIYESEIKPEGIIFPRVNTAQRDAITAVQGQCIYNIDTNNTECFDGTTWQSASENSIAFEGYSGPSYSWQDGTSGTIFNLPQYDGSGNFDGTFFTAPTSGFYHFDAAIHLEKENTDIAEVWGYMDIGTGQTGTNPFKVKIDSNGEIIHRSRTMYVNAGDKIGVFVQIFTGGPTVWIAGGGAGTPGGAKTYFAGFKVGKATNALQSFQSEESSKKVNELIDKDVISNQDTPTKYEEIKNEIELLRKELNLLKESISETHPKKRELNIVDIDKPQLKQNMPNPFNGITTIGYYVPSNSKTATIRVYTVAGQLIEEMAINNYGIGEIEVVTDKLSDEIYYYSLEVDGMLVDTKKMTSIK